MWPTRGPGDEGPVSWGALSCKMREEQWKGGCWWGLKEKRKLFNLTKLRPSEAHSTRGSEPKQPLLSQESPKWLPPCSAIPEERRRQRRGFSCNSLLDGLFSIDKFLGGGAAWTQKLEYAQWDPGQYAASMHACVRDCGAVGNCLTICVLFTPQFGRTAKSSEAGVSWLTVRVNQAPDRFPPTLSPPTSLKKKRKHKTKGRGDKRSIYLGGDDHAASIQELWD